jgi:hypothetical protein
MYIFIIVNVIRAIKGPGTVLAWVLILLFQTSHPASTEWACLNGQGLVENLALSGTMEYNIVTDA